MTPDDVRALIIRETGTRSAQKQIGPSELGGCRRRTYHRIHGTPHTNQTLMLPALIGTAWHKHVESLLVGDRFILEQRVEHGNIRGTIDCYDTLTHEIIDWKTIQSKNIPYFPTQQQKWQIHTYGWLLSHTKPVTTVCLVGIPRDGTEHDIVTFTEPYDPRVAEEARAWLDDLMARTSPPAPEKPRFFCRNWCPYYDPTGKTGCPSK